MSYETEIELYEELSAKHGWPESKYLPMIIRKMITPDQAQILLQLPANSESISKNIGIEKEIVDNNMQEMFEKGIAFPSKKGWRLGRIIDSLHDLTLSNKKYWDSYGGEEIANLWNAFEELEWLPAFADHVRSLDAPLMRILPAMEAVRDYPGLLPEEDVRELFKSTSAITLIPCPCRVEQYERKCDAPDEMCISVNRSAEYNLKRGVGKKLTVEEAIAFEETARKHNSISVVPNTKELNMVMCNCHDCCCIAFRAFKDPVSVQGMYAKSRFQASVETEKCTGCQKCIETCLFEAIELKKYSGMKKWKAFIDPERCMGCGNCVVKCPKKDAVSLKVVRPPEHIPEPEVDVYAYGDAKK
ncbi:MAG: 4Fe-4S binding protein [Desulfobacterales bacterium]|nr:4Fe-4S binding protein [Desulfobacterales bacterium]